MTTSTRPSQSAWESQRWIRFADGNGPGWAQPDFYLVQPRRVICWEAKLSYVPEGLDQLTELYVPLLEHIYERPVLPILVFKNPSGVTTEHTEFSDTFNLPAFEDPYLWHWLPR